MYIESALTSLFLPPFFFKKKKKHNINYFSTRKQRAICMEFIFEKGFTPESHLPCKLWNLSISQSQADIEVGWETQREPLRRAAQCLPEPQCSPRLSERDGEKQRDSSPVIPQGLNLCAGLRFPWEPQLREHFHVVQVKSSILPSSLVSACLGVAFIHTYIHFFHRHILIYYI